MTAAPVASPPALAAGPEDPWPAPDVLVLRGRVVRPGTPDSQMSRFGDPDWILQPAHPDAHQGVWAIHWKDFPPGLVMPFKTISLALLDHPVPESWGTRAGRDMSIMTARGWVRHMRVLATWMDSRGLSLNDLDDRHFDAYRRHVTALSVPAERKRDLLNVVILVHAYRDLLPAECRIGPRPPWNGATGENLVPVTSQGTVNKTPPDRPRDAGAPPGLVIADAGGHRPRYRRCPPGLATGLPVRSPVPARVFGPLAAPAAFEVPCRSPTVRLEAARQA